MCIASVPYAGLVAYVVGTNTVNNETHRNFVFVRVFHRFATSSNEKWPRFYGLSLILADIKWPIVSHPDLKKQFIIVSIIQWHLGIIRRQETISVQPRFPPNEGLSFHFLLFGFILYYMQVSPAIWMQFPNIKIPESMKFKYKKENVFH